MKVIFNFKFIIFNSRQSLAGFTLIEILIAITILSLVGVVATPNLRKFSNEQILETNFQDLKNVVKQAQSSGSQGIKCASKPAIQWKITINPTGLTSVGKQGYKLSALCQDTADPSPIEEPRTSREFSSGIAIIQTGCPSKLNNIDLAFKSSIFSVDCKDGNSPVYPFEIHLKNNNNSPQSPKILKINPLGVTEQ